MRVAVIGAGASGLATVKCCLEEGLQVECFEQGHGVGGLWRYSEDQEGHSSVYQSLVINTSKELSCFSDFPMPREFAPFLPHFKMLEYYDLYAEHFGLKKYVLFDCRVVKVNKLRSALWQVIYHEGTDSKRHCGEFDAVFICTGHLWQPRLVEYPGLSDFKGKVLHSHSYKNIAGFENKTILVIGLGNSAADIAVDLSRHAKQVYISTRSGALIISRLVAGIPYDYFINNRAFKMLPRWLAQIVLQYLILHQLNHTHYGLEIVGDRSKAPIVTNDELPIRISTGTIVIKTDITRFNERSVEFVDGSRIDCLDVIVLCTGYTIGFEFLDDEIICPPLNNDLKLYKHIFLPHQPAPTLAFIGFLTIKGAMNPTVEMQARWAVSVVKGAIQLPSQDNMLKEITNERRQLLKYVHDRPRNANVADGISYNDSLGDQIGCRPRIFPMLFKDPILALTCFFGPCHPAQYRLSGPGLWQGARHAIMKWYSNLVYPTMTRKVDSCALNQSGPGFGILMILFVLLTILLFLLLFLLI